MDQVAGTTAVPGGNAALTASVGVPPPPPKVSKGEVLLYGDHAGFVRKVGDASEALRHALSELAAGINESRCTEPPPEHVVRWQERFDRVSALHEQLVEESRSVAEWAIEEQRRLERDLARLREPSEVA